VPPDETNISVARKLLLLKSYGNCKAVLGCGP
jgi:hypothetical protein